MTARVTAAQVRRDARTRLILLAADNPKFRGPYDPDRLTSDSLHILRRWALETALATGDRVEVDRIKDTVAQLVPIASGDTVALPDAVADGGLDVVLGETPALPGPDDRPAPTMGELKDVLGDLAEVAS